MKDYADSRITLPIPEQWKVWEDESGHLLYQDPAEDSAWCFIQFSGVSPKSGGPSMPSPKVFMMECYESELAAGVAVLTELPNNRALLEWIEDEIYDGVDFSIYHCNIAQHSQAGHLQSVDLAAAVPCSMRNEIGERYKDMLRLQAESARFKEWHDDTGDA